MALIKCTECGKEISSDAVACPNCGCPNCDSVSSDHNPNGLANIRKAIKAELRRCAMKDWSIHDNSEEVGRISAVTFAITAQGQRATKEFYGAEIDNSYLAIIPEVGTKIRDFVDRFARHINRSTSS